MSSVSANCAWCRNLQRVLTTGEHTYPRGNHTLEILNNTSIVDMRYPVVTNAQRKMGYRFLAAEAHWILSGDNRVETILQFAKHIGSFSDNGYVFQGAYGPRVTEQLHYVTETLVNDNDSRQAIIEIWRPNPRNSKDIPCTLTLQFLIRNGQIHTIANMRSSDLWLGWVYDVFNFTMITAWVELRLREMGLLPRELGTLFLNAGSQHIYDLNKSDAVKALSGESWSYSPLDLIIFNTPGSLMQHLVALRDRDWDIVGSKFLYELKNQVP